MVPYAVALSGVSAGAEVTPACVGLRVAVVSGGVQTLSLVPGHRSPACLSERMEAVKRRDLEALKAALKRSVLITSIEVPPPTVTAEQIRARADAEAGRSRLGLWLTLAAVAVMFAGIVVVCGWSIPG